MSATLTDFPDEALCIAEEQVGPNRPMPNPTEADLADPVFEAIWQVIKKWDVNVPEFYSGYCGANGSHVMLILEAIRGAQ